MWETDEPIPTRDFAIKQDTTAFAGRKLLLDGQQHLTSLTAVLNGDPIAVRRRKRPIEILFNLDHPDGPPSEATDVDSNEDSPLTPDDELSDGALRRISFILCSHLPQDFRTGQPVLVKTCTCAFPDYVGLSKGACEVTHVALIWSASGDSDRSASISGSGDSRVDLDKAEQV